MTEPKTQVALLPEQDSLNPIQLLSIAVQKGVDTEQLKALMELQREWKAEQARDAFVSAMNTFRAKALKVIKTKTVAYKDVSYKHATLANIVEIAAPALSECGLSHRWETSQKDGLVDVSCVITHQFGHSERTTLCSAPDNTGGKNSIQAIGSAVSYLQRYTFMAITGLAAQDQDNDGKPPEVAYLTPDQVTVIVDLLDETKAAKAAFLNWLKAETVETIREVDYERACAQLKKKLNK